MTGSEESEGQVIPADLELDVGSRKVVLTGSDGASLAAVKVQLIQERLERRVLVVHRSDRLQVSSIAWKEDRVLRSHAEWSCGSDDALLLAKGTRVSRRIGVHIVS